MQHVFISYVHENKEVVDKLCQDLTSQSIKVWRDLQNLKPGSFWKEEIRKAIREGGFFIACFSKEYDEHDETYMNEELIIAIEKLRQRHPGREWFIPIKLNECELPDIDIGRGKTLEDITYVKLYENWKDGIQRIVKIIQPESPEPTEDGNTHKERTNQNGDPESSEGFIGQNSGHAKAHLSDSSPNSKLTDWVFQQGNFLLKHQQLDKAIEAYSHAIDLNLRNADAYTSSLSPLN